MLVCNYDLERRSAFTVEKSAGSQFVFLAVTSHSPRQYSLAPLSAIPTRQILINLVESKSTAIPHDRPPVLDISQVDVNSVVLATSRDDEDVWVWLTETYFGRVSLS